MAGVDTDNSMRWAGGSGIVAGGEGRERDPFTAQVFYVIFLSHNVARLGYAHAGM